MQQIAKLTDGLPVEGMRQSLSDHPDLWDTNKDRTADPESPHFGLHDMWCRFTPPGLNANQPHESIWYPSADILPVRDLVYPLMSMCRGDELGGVLITKIPAGKMCRPHSDHTWHAGRYEKFGVQIQSAPGQAFHFKGESLVTQPGDLFWFNNSQTHWVTNESEFDRITMIVCIRTDMMKDLS